MDDEILRLYRSGLGRIKISRALQIKESTVRSRLEYLGEPRRPRTLKPDDPLRREIEECADIPLDTAKTTFSDWIRRGASIGLLAKIWKVEWDTIASKLIDVGYLEHVPYISEEKEKKICEQYLLGQQSTDQLKNMSGMRFWKVKAILHKNRIAIKDHIEWRKYDVDDEYFEVINTEEKSYFLGLLCADGYINEESGYLAITLKEKDLEIIQQFKSAICTNSPICDHFINGKNYPRIRVYSRKMIDDLVKHGCTARKSLTLQFPKTVSHSLIRHFIRGYFDGDGYVKAKWEDKGPNKSPQIAKEFSILGTKPFLTKLRKEVQRATGVQLKNINRPSIGKAQNIGCYSTSSLLKIFHYLYRDATVFLKRKKDVFLHLKYLLEKKQNAKVERLHSSSCLFTVEEIHSIRAMHKEGYNTAQIARILNKDYFNVYNVVSGRTYKSVQ